MLERARVGEPGAQIGGGGREPRLELGIGGGLQPRPAGVRVLERRLERRHAVIRRQRLEALHDLLAFEGRRRAGRRRSGRRRGRGVRRDPLVELAQDGPGALHRVLVVRARRDQLEIGAVGEPLDRRNGGVLELAVHRHRDNLLVILQRVERRAADRLEPGMPRDRSQRARIGHPRQRVPRRRFPRDRLDDL